MANEISKNVQKTAEVGLITAISTVITYIVCLYLKWDIGYVSVSLMVILSALLGGVYNLLKHLPINWNWITDKTVKPEEKV